MSSHEEVFSPRPVAVIDIGTTSIRLAIGEIGQDANVRTLETLTRAVNLGKDTFTRGEISRTTIEDCVKVLKSYQQILREYQIASGDQMRVVATSAVREATNRLGFLDRIYIATGIEVETIEDAEVNRITYMGIQPFLATEPSLKNADLIVTEVGGGNTELLLVIDGDVRLARTYRLGSMRLRKTLETFRTPTISVSRIMVTQIQRTVQQVLESLPESDKMEMIALGGDVRFATSELSPNWETDKLARLDVDALEEFTNRLLRMSDDEIVQRYNLSYPEAEPVGPALLAYTQLARACELKQILVTDINLRDGLLKEMAVQEAWTKEFRNQIVRSALTLGRRFEFDEVHAQHVAHLAHRLFLQLQSEHQLDSRHEIVLFVAALLHEVGMFINTRSHHKHTMYLISNSEIFGLSKSDLMMAAMVARYHRRASPHPKHEGFAALNREHRTAVSKLAAMLRVAVALATSRSQRIGEFDCEFKDKRLVISIPHVDDLSLEQLALRQSGSIFEEVFGVTVQLRTIRK